MRNYPASASRLPSSTSATTTDLPSVERESLTPRETRRMIDLSNGLGMGGNVATLPRIAKCEHDRSVAYRPLTEAQAMALRALRAVPSPVSPMRVARQLRWPHMRARYWVTFFEVKGVLVRDGGGLVWGTP